MKVIPIKDNLENGDCILWYDVFVYDKKYHKHIHCFCPLNECKSFKDAIKFYKKYLHEEDFIPICVQYHKFSREDLEQLSKAC